jgi:hypothetical protein
MIEIVKKVFFKPPFMIQPQEIAAVDPLSNHCIAIVAVSVRFFRNFLSHKADHSSASVCYP